MIWYALSHNRATQTCNPIWLSLLTLYTRLRNWYKKHISIQFTLFNHNNGSRLAVYARLRLLARLSDDKCSHRGAHTFQTSSIPWQLRISFKKFIDINAISDKEEGIWIFEKEGEFCKTFSGFLEHYWQHGIGKADQDINNLTSLARYFPRQDVVHSQSIVRALSRLPPCLDP